MRRGRASRRRRRQKLKAGAVSSASVCGFNPDGRVYHELVKWMSKVGFKYSKKLKPYTFPDTGRGLMSRETIDPGDVVISIPENLLIKPHMVLGGPLGPYIKRYCPNATGQEILSVFLMCEKAKGTDSFWNPYIVSLPTSYTIPAYCNNSDVSAFPPHIKHYVLQQMDSVKNSFEKMSKLFISLENSFPQFHGIFQYGSYRWAWSSVNTRCVYIECENHQCKGSSCSYHLALAPFLDLLNHHYDAQVKAGFNREQRCYEIKSLKHFKKCSQVFINYGNHSNWQLFLDYGFVLENNFNDIIPISLDDILSACKNLSSGDKVIRKKQILLKYDSQMSNVGFCKDGLTWGMDMLLKILCTEKITGSLGTFQDVCMNGNEKALYSRLARGVILVKLKDFLWLSNDVIKLDTSVDEETEIIFNTAHYLCSLEQKMLLDILHSIENS